jgi:hypothetical protein
MTTSGYVLRHLRVIRTRAIMSIDDTRRASRASPQRIATVLTDDENLSASANFLRAWLKE